MKTICVLALSAACIPPALAVDIKAGDWNVAVGGIVNAYATVVDCGGEQPGGLALGGAALGCGGKERRTTIGNGLLPNALTASATSTQGGYDVKALVGIYAATATDSAISQNSTVDVRQAYFTFGRAGLGTFKLGRDYGIFGSNAILGDMTLVGAGAPVQATQRGRVTLGHIGAGYAYLGTYGQIAYSSPDLASGVGADVAVMSPVADTPVVAGAAYSSGSTPQLQARLRVAQGGFKGWLGVKGQRFEAETPGMPDLSMRGIEAGASLQAGPAGFLVNVQRGTALGILSDADQGDVRTTHYLVQATYKVTDALKLGVAYGRSRNSDAAPGTAGLKSNSNATLGAYYALNSAITLVAEAGQTRSEAFAGAEGTMNGVSLGGIIFF
ncbi:porin [Pseudoduganella umbonata]|uniref:Porin n=1 Tax=Pseudoduganella umbonata TaxID=864828 RepID=A0A4P8HHW6_9BURK|nr:porin [Pseudoduganella umbonata]MBB3224916.1 putative porin [Pseudoduganella umbonata]QCP09199.1 porin [Pseudoduganella umbonata]